MFERLSAIPPDPILGIIAAHAVDHLHDRAPHAAAVAPAHVTDRALEAARAAVELHGGIGYTWESDVQIWFKRALFDRGYLGLPDVHRVRPRARLPRSAVPQRGRWRPLRQLWRASPVRRLAPPADHEQAAG